MNWLEEQMYRTLLGVLSDIKTLWDAEGFGRDEAVSEPLYARLRGALEAGQRGLDAPLPDASGGRPPPAGAEALDAALGVQRAWTLVQAYPLRHSDGQPALVFACRLPATFYRIEALPSTTKAGFLLQTGSGPAMRQLAHQLGQAISEGLLGLATRETPLPGYCPHCGRPETGDPAEGETCDCLTAACGHRLSAERDDAPPCEVCDACQGCCQCPDNDFRAGRRGD